VLPLPWKEAISRVAVDLALTNGSMLGAAVIWAIFKPALFSENPGAVRLITSGKTSLFTYVLLWSVLSITIFHLHGFYTRTRGYANRYKALLRWRRDKQGFMVPEQLWLRRELVPVIRRRFRGSTLAELDILNDKKFLLYYDRFLTGHAIASSDIARVLIAEIWAGQVFQSGTSRTQIGHQPTSLVVQPAVC
jgi:hypothetical protein